MAFAFDPDEVDLSSNEELLALTAMLGLNQQLTWSTPGAATAAKQAEMYDIDREMFEHWLRAMAKLMERGLSDAEFTAERMLRLKLWEKERKRRQYNLHFRYDGRRRKGPLIAKAVAEQAAKMKARIESAGERLSTIELDSPPVPKAVPPHRVPGARPEPRDPVATPPRSVEAPSEAERWAEILSAVALHTGIEDPERATGEDIRAAYAANGITDGVDELLQLIRARA